MIIDSTIAHSQAVQKAETGGLMSLSAVNHASEASSGIPVQSQTADLIKTLANPETGDTYKNAATITWNLLKKTTLLLFYLSVLVFGLFVWLCGIGFQGGHYFREWIEVKRPSLSEVVCAVLRAIAFPFVSLYHWAATMVRQTLGWEVQFNSIQPDDETPSDSQQFSAAPATGAEPQNADAATAQSAAAVME
jgi:hypothetical protein